MLTRSKGFAAELYSEIAVQEFLVSSINVTKTNHHSPENIISNNLLKKNHFTFDATAHKKKARLKI